MQFVLLGAMMFSAAGLRLNSNRDTLKTGGEEKESGYTFTLHGTACDSDSSTKYVTFPKIEVVENGQSGGEKTIGGEDAPTTFTVSHAKIEVKFKNDLHKPGNSPPCDRNVYLTYPDGTFVATFPSQWGAGKWKCDGATPNIRCRTVKAGEFKWSGTYPVAFTPKKKAVIQKVGASGDPKAVNARGEKFDIQRLGTHNFLAITNASDSNSEGIPLMSLDATVGRAGPSCDHTYILNLTLSGSWIQEATPTKIKIRAVPHRLKNRALEIFFNDEWHEMSEIEKNRGQDLNILQKATAEALVLDMHGVKIAVSVDLHRIRPAMEYASFLNVDVKGINQLIGKDGIHLHGLLAYDDHAFATEAPDDCKMHSERRQLLFNDVSSQPALTSMMQPALMSIVRLSS